MQKLLLHICCGPCSTHVLDILSQQYDITGYFYNPNIYPEEEYCKRLNAVREVAGRTGITLIEAEYDCQSFLNAVKGFENEPENGLRCKICYRLRLSKTAQYAGENSFDCFASTLTLGPQKKASVINPIGLKSAEDNGLVFIEGDWKKKDGFKHSCELSNRYEIYRHNYCGCIFSLHRENSN